MSPTKKGGLDRDDMKSAGMPEALQYERTVGEPGTGEQLTFADVSAKNNRGQGMRQEERQ